MPLWLLRGAGRVGDEQHSHVLVGDDAVDPLAALLRELAVADGQRLVHHQSDDDTSYIYIGSSARSRASVGLCA